MDESSGHHNLKLVKTKNPIFVEIETSYHVLAVVHTPPLSQSTQHSFQALGRDAPATSTNVHVEGLLQITRLLLFSRAFDYPREILQAQQPVSVGIHQRHRSLRLFRGHLPAHGCDALLELHGAYFTVSVGIEEIEYAVVLLVSLHISFKKE